jgi:S-adenosylmethionine:tRNA-ribosyltransferase-isomerase (queuine synthetase)
VGGADDQAGNGVGTRSGARAALEALLAWMERRWGLTQLVTTTQLLITPGYDLEDRKGAGHEFSSAGSTLLLLVASLIGEDWRKMYTTMRWSMGFDSSAMGMGACFCGRRLAP